MIVQKRNLLYILTSMLLLIILQQISAFGSVSSNSERTKEVMGLRVTLLQAQWQSSDTIAITYRISGLATMLACFVSPGEIKVYQGSKKISIKHVKSNIQTIDDIEKVVEHVKILPTTKEINIKQNMRLEKLPVPVHFNFIGIKPGKVNLVRQSEHYKVVVKQVYVNQHLLSGAFNTVRSKQNICNNKWQAVFVPGKYGTRSMGVEVDTYSSTKQEMLSMQSDLWTNTGHKNMVGVMQTKQGDYCPEQPINQAMYIFDAINPKPKTVNFSLKYTIPGKTLKTASVSFSHVKILPKPSR